MKTTRIVVFLLVIFTLKSASAFYIHPPHIQGAVHSFAQVDFARGETIYVIDASGQQRAITCPWSRCFITVRDIKLAFLSNWLYFVSSNPFEYWNFFADIDYQSATFEITTSGFEELLPHTIVTAERLASLGVSSHYWR